jgi:HAAS domain-containing protein
VTYLDELSRELARHGIRGAARRRILAEVDDHLRSAPDAQERFGSPSELANEFAAELGSDVSRRAAALAFAALAVAGAVYAGAFVSLAFASPPTETLEPTLGAFALAAMVVAPQVAFVAGSLALVRALRRRGRVMPTAELTVLRRRTLVALASGTVTMGALVLYAYEFAPSLAGWWTTTTYVSAASAAVLLAAASVPALRAARLRPQVAGPAGDVFDDLGFEGGDPWRLARWVALAVGGAVWLAGVVQGDPVDGLVRGTLEAAACFAGFAALGRYLGLRR